VERVSGIAESINEQAQASEEISRTMQSIKSMAENMDEAMAETTREVESLKRLADSLQKEINTFQA